MRRPDVKPSTILVVEDNLLALKMVRVTLESEGYKVLQAPDAQTAIGLMTRHAPDLVLQDLVLPDMKGTELIKRLRALPMGREIPILAFSGLTSELEQAQTLQAGFTDYLFKPVEPSRLLAMVQTYLGGNATAEQKAPAGNRILIVDDDPVIRKLLQVQLRQRGFDVAVASDGAEALRAARLSPPDAILSDVLMPVLDGFRLCLEVRKDPHLALIPVVLTSAVFIDDEDKQLARRVGANALVTRTSDHAEAIEALVNCLHAGPPPIPAAGDPKMDHFMERMIRQLDRQAAANLTLMRRATLYEAQLSILAGLPEIVRSTSSDTLETMLSDLLGRCLNAAGLPRGVIFLTDGDSQLTPRAAYPSTPEGSLTAFAPPADLLRSVMANEKPLRVVASPAAAGWHRDLLEQVGAKSILMVPVGTGAERLGVLAVSSDQVMGEEWVSFVKVIGSQIGHVLILTRAISALRTLNAQLEQRVADQTAEVRKAQGFLENLIALSPSMVFESDPTNGRSTYISPNAERIYGFTVQEILGAPGFWEDHVHLDDRASFNALRTTAINNKEAEYEVEYRFRHKDGSYRWIHSTIRIQYDKAGKAVRIFGYDQDTTARKAVEEALKQARLEADRSNRAKSEFLSRMSHELRTPLNAILGFGQLLDLGDLTPDQRESVRHVLGAGRHLLRLIDEVLDIARIEAGHLGFSPEAVPIGITLELALDLIRPMAAEKNVQLRAAPPASCDTYVLADQQRLSQVLLNLLSNAVKYNRAGGSVTLSCDIHAGKVRFSVRDTGRGIAPGNLERLFSPFERLDATQAGIEGTGLGLALSKHLIEAMGGTIGVESVLGTGSTFWIELPSATEPLVQIEAPIARDAKAPSPAGTGGTVLYIEDNLSNFRLVERIIALRPGVRLISAMQGRLGLDLAQTHRPDLILLDVHLPDVSGAEVLAQLQGDARLRGIPVVMISADAIPATIERFLAQGASAYLTKPLDVKKLLALVDERLKQPSVVDKARRSP